MNPIKQAWEKLTKKKRKPSESVIYLGMPLSRPFSWVSETDGGNRPCFRVTGTTVSEAEEKFIGKSVDWATIDYSYLKELELGGGIVDITAENLQRIMK